MFRSSRPPPPGPALPPGDVFGAPTGEDGRFTISNETPGEYYVVVWHPGYISAKEYRIRVEDASDFETTPKRQGALQYNERTLVQKYGPVSADIKVAGTDVTNLSLTAAPIQ